MTKSILLYGRILGAKAGEDGLIHVDWSEAANFHEAAGHMIAGEFENAIVLPTNCSPGATDAARVSVSIERTGTTFKGYAARPWLSGAPYTGEFDLDWVAYIPCSTFLTG